jgi:hypothetical protein
MNVDKKDKIGWQSDENFLFIFMLIDLFLAGLGGRLGDLTGTSGSLLNGLDDTDGDGLTHVTDGETTEWWVGGEGLDTHWLGRNHLDDSGITRLDKLGVVFDGFAGTSVNLLEELSELASNVGSVAIQDWSVTGTDLTGVVEDDDLGVEGSGTHWWIVLGVTADVSTTDFLDGNVLDVETNVVSGNTLDELFVVHFDGLDFSGDVGWSEGDNHTGLDDTGFDTTDWDSSDTTDLVDVLEWETERLVGWTDWGLDGIDGFEESLAAVLAGLGLLLPTLVPRALVGGLDHVVTIETRDGDEWDSLGVVSDLLDEGGGFLDDFVITVLGEVDSVHLVEGNDELLDTESEGQEGVFTSLTILGDTGFEFTDTGGDDKNGTISLGGTSNHVLDKVTMSGGINDGNVVLWSLELPEGDINGDTTLTLSLELVQDPGVLEGTLAHLLGLSLELLDGTLVDAAALVDEVASRGRLARVHVPNDDKIDVSLFLAHVCRRLEFDTKERTR